MHYYLEREREMAHCNQNFVFFPLKKKRKEAKVTTSLKEQKKKFAKKKNNDEKKSTQSYMIHLETFIFP